MHGNMLPTLRTKVSSSLTTSFLTPLRRRQYPHRCVFPRAAFVAIASLAVSHFARTTTTASSSFAMSTTATVEAYPTAVSSARKKRLVYGSSDALFGHIEAQQGTKPFGSFLDAGTGVHSLRWIATLAGEEGESNGKRMTDFTAVTADESMRRNCQKEVNELGVSKLGKVVIGNWFPPDGDDKQSLSMIDKDEEGNLKQYDTILADYLIGAMDGFSPYTQDQMIDKLARRLKPGGRMYIVGLQPIPYSFGSDPSNPENIICEVRKVRDACILLAGDRMYREYPLDWVERQITKTMNQTKVVGNDEEVCTAGDTPLVREDVNVPLKHINSATFPILYRHKSIVKQIAVGRNKLPRFPSKTLASEMKQVLDDLEKKSLEATEKIPGKRIKLGFDYVVTVERPLLNSCGVDE